MLVQKSIPEEHWRQSDQVYIIIKLRITDIHTINSPPPPYGEYIQIKAHTTKVSYPVKNVDFFGWWHLHKTLLSPYFHFPAGFPDDMLQIKTQIDGWLYGSMIYVSLSTLRTHVQ